MSLVDKIHACKECINLMGANRLETSDKPYVFFQVAENWLPRQGVKVLFIAESPPWNGEQRYFYKTQKTGRQAGLRREVLNQLNLSSLETFKDKGYFLTDAIPNEEHLLLKKGIFFKFFTMYH